MRSIAGRPALPFGLGLIAAVAAFHLWVTPTKPAGYHRDEAGLLAKRLTGSNLVAVAVVAVAGLTPWL